LRCAAMGEAARLIWLSVRGFRSEADEGGPEMGEVSFGPRCVRSPCCFLRR